MHMHICKRMEGQKQQEENYPGLHFKKKYFIAECTMRNCQSRQVTVTTESCETTYIVSYEFIWIRRTCHYI